MKSLLIAMVFALGVLSACGSNDETSPRRISTETRPRPVGVGVTQDKNDRDFAYLPSRTIAVAINSCTAKQTEVMGDSGPHELCEKDTNNCLAGYWATVEPFVFPCACTCVKNDAAAQEVSE